MCCVQELLISSPHLLELHLAHNGLQDSQFSILVDAMWSPNCRLQVLDLTRNSLSAAAVGMLLPHCCAGALSATQEPAVDKPLREFKAAGGEAGRDQHNSGEIVLSRAPSCSALQLMHVTLSDNPIGDNGVRLFCEVVCKATTKCLLHTLAVRFLLSHAHTDVCRNAQYHDSFCNQLTDA
jgi:hypothetical protein